MSQSYEYCEECGKEVIKRIFICKECLEKMEEEHKKLFESE